MDSETDSGCGISNSSEFPDSGDERDGWDDAEKNENPVCPRPIPNWQLPITRFLNVHPPTETRDPPQEDLGEGSSKEANIPDCNNYSDDDSSSGRLIMDIDDAWYGDMENLLLREIENDARKKKHAMEEQSQDEPPAKKKKEE